MKWDDKTLNRLYQVFRGRMHEVYRKNRKPDPFGDSMTVEFNAWQLYLRESLSLEVVDEAPGDRPGVVRDRDGGCKVKIVNPSNGASYGNEFILVPAGLAEKALTLGGLPDKL